MLINAFRLFAPISLIFSFTLAGANSLIQANHKLILKSPILEKVLNNRYILPYFIISQQIFRQVSRLSDENYARLIKFDFFVLITFVFLRSNVILNNPYIIISPIFIYIDVTFTTFYVLLRGLYKLGALTEAICEESPKIALSINGAAEKVAQYSANFMKNWFITNPNLPKPSRDNRMFLVNRNQLYVAGIGVGVGVGVLYYSREGALAAIASATAAERTADMQAVSQNFMSRDYYTRKWDEFGNRRKQK